MAREFRSGRLTISEREREIDRIVTALTERGFYILRPEGTGATGSPDNPGAAAPRSATTRPG